MGAGDRQTFPLVPRRRLTGLPFGDRPSRRRGPGSDIIGARDYQRGDPVSSIDWRASARVSAAVGQDHFIVREHAADETPRVVIVCDRRPGMGLFDETLPWLSKPAALLAAATAVAASAAAAHTDVGLIDYAGLDARGGEPFWLAPTRIDGVYLTTEREGFGTPFDAPDDSLEAALLFLGRLRSTLPTGSFVFLLSDFLVPLPSEALLLAVGRGWDVVPVVIQDPVWEQSFPAVGSVIVPVGEPGRPGVRLVRLSRREAAARRTHNGERLHDLLEELASVGADPILLGTSDRQEVDQAFIGWAEARRLGAWLR